MDIMEKWWCNCQDKEPHREYIARLRTRRWESPKDGGYQILPWEESSQKSTSYSIQNLTFDLKTKGIARARGYKWMKNGRRTEDKTAEGYLDRRKLESFSGKKEEK